MRETQTKPDCGVGKDGMVITRDFDEITKISELSSIPVVVGGGLKLEDIPSLTQTGVDGFFVVSEVTEADNPEIEATNLVNAWNLNKAR